jgi:hypothetical protein
MTTFNLYLLKLQLKSKNVFFRVRNFNSNYGFAYSSSTSAGVELRDFQMPEVAYSAEIHLGIGPRYLWNVWPKTAQKGLYEIYLKYQRIMTCMGISHIYCIYYELEF